MLGKVLNVDFSPSSGLVLRGGRVRVILNVSKPILAGFWKSRKDEGPFWVDLRYKKLPVMCFRYRVLDHDTRTCRRKRAVEDESPSLFGVWLKYEEQKNTPKFAKKWFLKKFVQRNSKSWLGFQGCLLLIKQLENVIKLMEVGGRWWFVSWGCWLM